MEDIPKEQVPKEHPGEASQRLAVLPSQIKGYASDAHEWAKRVEASDDNDKQIELLLRIQRFFESGACLASVAVKDLLDIKHGTGDNDGNIK